ncbi:GNAT family N-acetyltransferase [bacterium]|nr:GNAT family N-acetyltransferase [bacterium]
MEFYTNRCFLSSLNQTDYKDIERLYSDEITREFLGGTLSPEDFKNRFESMLKNQKALHWVIRSILDKTFIGLITLDQHHDETNKEISYQLIASQFKKGYAIEVIPTILNYCFKNFELNTIIAETQSSNINSIKLLNKIGFSFQKTLYRFGVNQDIYVIHKVQ